MTPPFFLKFSFHFGISRSVIGLRTCRVPSDIIELISHAKFSLIEFKIVVSRRSKSRNKKNCKLFVTNVKHLIKLKNKIDSNNKRTNVKIDSINKRKDVKNIQVTADCFTQEMHEQSIDLSFSNWLNEAQSTIKKLLTNRENTFKIFKLNQQKMIHVKTNNKSGESPQLLHIIFIQRKKDYG